MRISQLLCVMVLSVLSVSAQARDDALKLPIADFFQRADVQEKLGNEVKFYLAGQKHRAVDQKFGEFQSNKKTNAFNKTDKQACEWALLSAFIALRDRALQMGGNAVVRHGSAAPRPRFPHRAPRPNMRGLDSMKASIHRSRNESVPAVLRYPQPATEITRAPGGISASSRGDSW